MKKNEAISILATSVRPREPKNRARYDEAVKMAIEALRQPERKAGVWLEDEDDPESIKTDGYCGYCSACKEMSEYLTSYCGSCGADMRGTWNEECG